MTNRTKNHHIDLQGCIYDQTGKLIFLNAKQFESRIIESDNCFICGCPRSDKIFNDEHVIPQWILRESQLYDKLFTLPNGKHLKYGSLTVPCCSECNTFLGKTYEDVLKPAFLGGYESFKEYLSKNGFRKLLIWLNLIFFKCHYKDKFLTSELDKRKQNNQTILEQNYESSHLHHIHCVSRSDYTGAIVDKKTWGSIWVLPAFSIPNMNQYDYGDNYASRSLFIRIGEIAIVCVLCDACGTLSSLYGELEKMIGGPLTQVQIREFFATTTYLNLLTENPPVFTSAIKNGIYKISSTHDEKLKKSEFNHEDYGFLLHHMIKEHIGHASSEVLTSIKKGKFTYLTKQDGTFQDAHLKGNNTTPPTKQDNQ